MASLYDILTINPNLTRREAIKTIGAIGMALIMPNPKSDYYEVIIPRKRQQYLEQLVKSKPFPYVNRVIYDHDTSLIRKLPDIYTKRAFDDPQFLKSLFDLSPSAQESGITQKDIEECLKSSECREEGINSFRVLLEKELDDELAGGGAVTPFYPFDFGKGIKSDIYLLSRAFEKIVIITAQKKIEVPIEERIRAILRHEHTHAEDIYKGIKLDDGLILDSSNYVMINPKVRRFVLETRAYLAQIDFASKQFGEKHPAYIMSLLDLLQYSMDSEDLIDTKKQNKEFKYYEKRLIEFQMNKIKSELKLSSGFLRFSQ